MSIAGRHLTGDAAAGRRVRSAPFRLLVYLGLAVLYLASVPANHVESWDGFFFAHGIETETIAEVSDTRLILYHFLARLAYVGLHAVGLPVSGFHLLLAVSILSAPLALIFLHRFLTRTLGADQRTALVCCALLGASYGFWRYAVEAEIYVPSIAAVLGILCLVFEGLRQAARSGRTGPWLSAGLLAGAAILLYQPNAVPLAIALPLALLGRTRLRWLAGYGLVGAAIVIGGYSLGHIVARPGPLTAASLLAFINERSAEFDIDPLSPRLAMESLLAIGHDIASTNWLFGYPAFAAAVQSWLPGRIIDDEVYMATRHPGLVALATVGCVALVLALAALCVAAVRTGLRRPAGRAGWFSVLWLAFYALVVGRLDSSQFEPWIMALPPLVLLAGMVAVDPVVRRFGPALPAALAAALLVLNGANIAMLKSPEGDRHRALVAWLLAEGRSDDLLVIPLRHFQFESFVLYNAPSRFISVERHGLDAAIAAMEASVERGGRIFTFESLFDPPAPLQARDPALSRALAAVGDALRPLAVPVATSEAGTLFEIRAGSAAALHRALP
jgi:hypothetical protein